MTAQRAERRRDFRLLHEQWRTWTPLVAVMLALFALVALPLLRTLQVNPLYDEMRSVSEPARTLLTRIHASLALQQSLLRDFVESRDSSAAARFQSEVENEKRAYAEFEPLARRLGPDVENQYHQLRDVERAWHSAVGKILARPNAGAFNRDPVHARLYEDMLLTAAHLDESLNAAAANRRAVIEATNRAQVWITFAVGLVALIAAVIVASLARRLRTFAISEANARRSLEEAIESRERLMRGITHDLKNPLQAISGSAELLDENLPGPVNELQRRLVGRIRASSNQLLSLISDLLELAAAEGGRLSIRPVEFSLPDLVADTATEYEKRAAAAKLSLTVEKANVPPVNTDPQRVRQILQNLISNAVKYTPEGGSVSVSMEARPFPGSQLSSSWVAVNVSDTGNGVPPDKIDSIFDEFTRLDSHRKVPGAGLGLAIAKRVSVLLGGTITLATSSSGSTFTLWIPENRQAGQGVTAS